MTPREEADRLVALIDTVRWNVVRDAIEAAVVDAEERGYARRLAEEKAEAERLYEWVDKAREAIEDGAGVPRYEAAAPPTPERAAALREQQACPLECPCHIGIRTEFIRFHSDGGTCCLRGAM